MRATQIMGLNRAMRQQDTAKNYPGKKKEFLKENFLKKEFSG